jgi:GntR family transcriptional repressor for pyruvate dehydrogenase complex
LSDLGREGARVSGSEEEDASRFAPVRGRRAFDEIIAQLRVRLRNDELRPGDRLPSERQLAEQFQVSRNTVREALRMLEIAGLVQIRKGATGGGFISRGTADVVAQNLSDMLSLMTFSLTDLTEVRLWLGSIITRAACERATEADLDRLQANVDRAAALTEAKDWERRAAVNHEFHNLLAAATANPLLEMFQRAITEVVREIVSAVGPMRDDVVMESRRRLLAHLRDRDADAAAGEMEGHLKKVNESWSKSGHTRPY